MANIFEVFTSGIKKSVAQPASQPGDVFPSGTILQYAGSTPPTNWLFCDGTAVSRTTFATLFGVVGTTYGAGDGSTTFNLPDLRDKVPVGKSGTKALGSTGGLATVALTTGQLPAHNHGVSDPGHGHGVSDPGHAHSGSVPGVFLINVHTNLVRQVQTGTFGTYADIADTPGITVNGAGTGISIVGNGTGISTTNTGSGSSHENMPPYLAVNHMIKT